jgi:hypothetical protein
MTSWNIHLSSCKVKHLRNCGVVVKPKETVEQRLAFARAKLPLRLAVDLKSDQQVQANSLDRKNQSL